MKKDNRPVPFYITKLIVGFFQQTLSEEENDLLDDWINESRENMEMFEDCIPMVENKISDTWYSLKLPNLLDPVR